MAFWKRQKATAAPAPSVPALEAARVPRDDVVEETVEEIETVPVSFLPRPEKQAAERAHYSRAPEVEFFESAHLRRTRDPLDEVRRAVDRLVEIRRHAVEPAPEPVAPEPAPMPAVAPATDAAPAPLEPLVREALPAEPQRRPLSPVPAFSDEVLRKLSERGPGPFLGATVLYATGESYVVEARYDHGGPVTLLFAITNEEVHDFESIRARADSVRVQVLVPDAGPPEASALAPEVAPAQAPPPETPSAPADAPAPPTPALPPAETPGKEEKRSRFGFGRRKTETEPAKSPDPAPPVEGGKTSRFSFGRKKAPAEAPPEDAPAEPSKPSRFSFGRKKEAASETPPPEKKGLSLPFRKKKD